MLFCFLLFGNVRAFSFLKTEKVHTSQTCFLCNYLCQRQGVAVTYRHEKKKQFSDSWGRALLNYWHSERSTHTSRPRFCKYVESNLNQPRPQLARSQCAMCWPLTSSQFGWGGAVFPRWHTGQVNLKLYKIVINKHTVSNPWLPQTTPGTQRGLKWLIFTCVVVWKLSFEHIFLVLKGSMKQMSECHLLPWI